MSPEISQQWSEMMAKDVCKNFQDGNAPRETALVEMFGQWINQIVAAENKNFLDEITNLAFQEKDSGKKAGYFKMARLVQARIPKVMKSPVDALTLKG
jgi:hypothetical protein